MLLLLAVLLTACRSDDKEEIDSSDEDCYLDIYVYAPDRPIVTRSDVGNIDQREAAESEVKTLQIWVFKHSDGSKVGYLGAGTDDDSNIPNPLFLNETGQQVYRMKVAKAFADAPEAVDVYVVANAASYVRKKSVDTAITLGEASTPSDLDDAMIGSASFGTATLVSAVPADGLPMSAVAKNQPVYGSFPALRIGTESQMTTLQLTRAVSKLRFVLCQMKNQDVTKQLVSIDRIKLDGGKLPTQTYLMPGTYSYSSLVTDEVVYVNDANKLLAAYIPQVDNPLVYAYETQSAQDYEDLINAAITGGQLKELGLTYLRESDKQLTGEIEYTYSENGVNQPQATATFSMAAPGDFLRNHSWIVYIYYMDSKIYTLTVTHIGMKSWVTDPLVETKPVYNW